MYYKDAYIEFRVGIGIKDFKKVTIDIPTLTLSKIVEGMADQVIQVFTTETGLTAYPTDGNYQLKVEVGAVPVYYITFAVVDSFITEFIKQVELVVCKCDCKCNDTPCSDSKLGIQSLKRQRMFNLASTIPYTIKPFLYGQSPANYNAYLFSYFQLYANEYMKEIKTELGEEYFNYYTSGTTAINNNLFNSTIASMYYGFYYYSLKLLLTGTDETFPNNTVAYTNTINTFFNLDVLKPCLKAYVTAIDLEALMDIAFGEDPDSSLNGSQNNYSRTITVTVDDLSGIGTIEEQIAEYVTGLGYTKEEIDSDIWIDFEDGTDLEE